jgi:hypothetical protein
MSGVMTYENARYEGQWSCDFMHGYGFYHFSSGAQYVGQWHEGKMHGQVRHREAEQVHPLAWTSTSLQPDINDFIIAA